MPCRRWVNLPLMALASLSLLTGDLAAALTQKYCSSQNTASSNPESDIYQSNGHCQTECQANYAFAVVQGQDCWCSNYIPAEQVSTSSCNEQCPGYPYEYCGSTSAGLYGYVALNKSPSGTAGAAGSSTSSQTTSGTSTSTKTLSSAAPSTTFSTSTTSSSKSSTSTWTPTPVITTIISSGSVVTITSTPTAAPIETQSSGGISKGAVAGVVVAAFAGLAIVALGLVFCLRRRRTEQHVVDSTGNMAITPQRMGSQLSRNGLLGSVFRNNSVAHTQQSSAGDVSPVSPINERRYSKPLVFDQRLNPDLYMHEDNSRVSITTLEDHRDYNRRLNIMNPDPDERD